MLAGAWPPLLWAHTPRAGARPGFCLWGKGDKWNIWDILGVVCGSQELRRGLVPCWQLQRGTWPQSVQRFRWVFQ